MGDWRRTLDFVLFRFVTVASPLLLLLLLRHLLHLFIWLSCFIQVNFIRFLLRPFQDQIFSHRRVVFWGGLRYVMGTGNGTIYSNGHWQLLETEIWGNQRDFMVRTDGDTSNPALVTWTLGGKVVIYRSLGMHCPDQISSKLDWMKRSIKWISNSIATRSCSWIGS